MVNDARVKKHTYELKQGNQCILNNNKSIKNQSYK
jgi:hypothetical protein